MLIWTNGLQPEGRTFLFLDRDGVINANRPDYIKSWEEFVFYPDALEALRWLRERRIQVVLISNQSAIHRGLVSWRDFWNIHTRMLRGIQEAKGDLLAAFYCPHHPNEHCSCRKPSPGMFLKACTLFSIPLVSSWMIGDRPSDLHAAARAGCRGAILERASTTEALENSLPEPTKIERYPSLLEAVQAVYGV